MKTKGRMCVSSPEREKGSTLIEVMASLTLLSTAGLLLGTAVSGAGTGLRKGMAEIRESVGIIVLRNQLEPEISRIRIPFWENVKAGCLADGTGLVLPYFDGERENILTVAFRDGKLFTDNGTEVHSLAVDGTVNFALLGTDDSSGVWGILAVPESNGKPGCGVELRVPFGSVRIPDEKEAPWTRAGGN